MTEMIVQPPPGIEIPPPQRRLKILLTTFGSHGDVHPFIAVGAALKARGHDVYLIANSYFEKQATNAGVELVSSGPANEYEEMLRDPDLWKRRGKGRTVLIERGIGQIIPRVYRALEALHEPGRTVAVASPWSFSGRIAEEKLGIPLATMIVSPQTLMSAHDPGVMLARLIPLRVRQWLIAWAERKILDPALTPSINKLRCELNLPPVKNVQSKWLYAPRRVICLWPEWFSAPQVDWPQQARTTGFVMYDGSGGRDLPEELKAFLAAGAPPIAFVPSTAMLNAGAFFAESVKACQRIGKRGVLLSKGTEHVPAKLPDSVIHVDYAPFHRLFPQCRAVVHQGAIGTAAFAIAAGLPQLAIPHGTDQPDNAARLARLGICTVLDPRFYRARIVGKLLNRITWSKHVAHQCKQYQQRIHAERPLDQICQMVEELDQMPAPRR